MAKLSKEAKRKEGHWKELRKRQNRHKGDFCYSVEMTGDQTASRFVMVDRKEERKMYTLLVNTAPEEGGITLTLLWDPERVVEYNYEDDTEGDVTTYTMGHIEYDKRHALDITVKFTDNEPNRYYVWVEKKRK